MTERLEVSPEMVSAALEVMDQYERRLSWVDSAARLQVERVLLAVFETVQARRAGARQPRVNAPSFAGTDASDHKEEAQSDHPNGDRTK